MKRLVFLIPALLCAEQATPKEQAAAVSSASQVLLIEPAARAKDLATAFQFIRKANPSAKLSIKLTSGKPLTDILSITPMEGGTLVIFKLNTIHGVKFQVEKIENIDSIIQS